MGLNWQSAFMGRNELPESEQKLCQAVVDEFGDALKAELASPGLPPHASRFIDSSRSSPYATIRRSWLGLARPRVCLR